MVDGYSEVGMPDGYLIRAHQKYPSGLQWYPWCMLQWGDERESDPIPAKVFMILDFTNTMIDYVASKEAKGRVYLEQSCFLLVRSAVSRPPTIDESEFKYRSSLGIQYDMEQMRSLVPLISVVGPTYVVENCGLSEEGSDGLIQNATHI